MCKKIQTQKNTTRVTTASVMRSSSGGYVAKTLNRVEKFVGFAQPSVCFRNLIFKD